MKDLPLPTLPIADLSALRSAESRAARRSLHPSSHTDAEPQQRQALEVVWARTEEDVLAAQRLRYQVFAEEMGARLSVPATAPAGHDVDLFDPYCEHLLVRLQGHDGEPGEVTLRGGADEVSEALTRELQERLAKAGVQVEEARLTHLAYAPEIAQAMLRRQQAEAVIAARQKIVHGAVSMVEMALNELSAKRVVQLDEERKAAMVSNLLVVLCGESEAHPVINTGTLYN